MATKLINFSSGNSMHKTKFIFIPLLLSALFLPFCPAIYAEAEPENDEEIVEFAEVEVTEAEDELSRIDSLISATEQSLERQKKLRALIADYRKIEKSCLENPKNPDLLFKLAKAGKMVHDGVQEAYLADYFQPEFVKELQKLKVIADKKSIPPVQ